MPVGGSGSVGGLGVGEPVPGFDGSPGSAGRFGLSPPGDVEPEAPGRVVGLVAPGEGPVPAPIGSSLRPTGRLPVPSGISWVPLR